MKKPFNPLWLLTLLPLLLIYWFIILAVTITYYNDQQNLRSAKNNLQELTKESGITQKADCSFSDYSYFWGQAVGASFTIYYINPSTNAMSALETSLISKGFDSNIYGSYNKGSITYTKDNLSGPRPTVTMEHYSAGEKIYTQNKCSGELSGDYYIVPQSSSVLSVRYTLD